MRRTLQLVLVLGIAVSIASVASHILAAWLGIETQTGRSWEIGPSNGKPPAYLAGSSLSGDAISWDLVSTQLDRRIGGWGVAGSSPWEWDAFQRKVPPTSLTILVVSPYDLNDQFLCDFHANVVPAADTIDDLWRSGANWQFSKRVLSQYPLMCLRVLFPTAGRSRGLIGELHDKLSKVLGFSAAGNSEAGPTLALGKETSVKDYKKEKISSWPKATLLRRLAALRSSCQGRHAFDGPKKLAFVRMLSRAQEHGRVIVVVLPVSPCYAAEFLDADVTRRFEIALADAQHSVPQAQWVRLDQLPALNSNECFWDLVHMNPDGQRIATEAFLNRLQTLSSSNQP
jgi:hypothetical protein